MDRSIDSGISEQLQPQADSNGFVNRRSVGSIPTTGSEFHKHVSPAESDGKSRDDRDSKDADRPFLLSLVRTGFRSQVSDNERAERLAVRFLSRIDRSAGRDACWPWLGKPNGDGYGTFYFGKRTIGAHRLACMVAHGPPPGPDMEACHDPVKCGSRLCCNPGHLRWDTSAGNQHDVRITLTRRGELNPKAKLTEAQAREIWRRRGECGYVLLARKMGLPEKAVRHVVDGTNWAWLTGARRVDRLALAVAIVKTAGIA